MGEANRRKAAGTYPGAKDPMDEARRLRDRCDIAVGDLRTPDGTVALTIEVEGTVRSTCVLNAAVLGELEPINELVRGCSFDGMVDLLATEYLKAKDADDDGKLHWISVVALWTIFNLPTQGEQVRKSVSARLRKSGSAHLIWRYNPSGLLEITLAPEQVARGSTAVDNTHPSCEEPLH